MQGNFETLRQAPLFDIALNRSKVAVAEVNFHFPLTGSKHYCYPVTLFRRLLNSSASIAGHHDYTSTLKLLIAFSSIDKAPQNQASPLHIHVRYIKRHTLIRLLSTRLLRRMSR